MRTITQPPNPETLLLKTKITIPRPSSEFVHRPRLTEQVQRGVQGPLTVISAPAGFGKTNLLVDWAHSTHLAVAWFSLDREDNHLERFSRYLVGAFQTLDNGFGRESVDFIASIRDSQVEAGVTLFLEEVCAHSKEFVLVMDDFQYLEDKAILRGMAFLIKHLPPNLHFVIASRRQPTIGLAALRAKGLVYDLGMNDLRFTPGEVEQLFNETMQLNLSTEIVHTLEQRTGGWVTGLQMAAISLRHQSDPTNLLSNLKEPTRFLIDFLAEEVLDKQPEEIRQFLLRCSILNTLTGPLCEAVVNPQAQPGFGSVMLNRLENENLFITALDERHEWFRFHPLFADFLRQTQAKINPGEISILQKRAALWFEQEGMLDQAVSYALASKEMEWAADLIERNIETQLKTGDIYLLVDWIGKLPDEVIHERPQIALSYAWGLIAAFRMDLANYWLDDVRRRIVEIEDQSGGLSTTGTMGVVDGTETSSLWNIRGGLAVCQSVLAVLSGDLEQAAEFSKEAASYLREENPFIRSLIALDDSLYFIFSGDIPNATELLMEAIRIARRANNFIVLIVATCQLAFMQAMQGRLSQAWATLQKAQYLVMGTGKKPLLLSYLVDIGLGQILFERGSFQEASTYLERGMEAVPQLWSVGALDGMVSLARLRQAQGDLAGCQAVISKAWQISISTESNLWDEKVVCALAVRLALLRDDLAEAEQWWRRSDLPPQAEKILLRDYPYQVYEYLQLTRARFLLVMGEKTENSDYLQISAELLETLLPEAKRLQRVTSQIEVLILLAQVQACQKNAQAVHCLLEALALGEPEGYWQIYLNEGWRLSGILAECLSDLQHSGSYFPSQAFIERLLAALSPREEELPAANPSAARRAGSISTKLDDGFPITLSAREMEVLTLIAEGKSNQEISAQLYLALNTVKRHAFNIFAKLDVKKRTHAVSRARQLGLIP